MSLNINIEFNEEKNFWKVEPEGEIDIYTSPQFNDELTKAINNKKSDIVIDGIKLDYLDSTGLGTLINIYKMLKDDENKIYLRNIKPNIRKLFDITKLDKVFIIEE